TRQHFQIQLVDGARNHTPAPQARGIPGRTHFLCPQPRRGHFHQPVGQGIQRRVLQPENFSSCPENAGGADRRNSQGRDLRSSQFYVSQDCRRCCRRRLSAEFCFVRGASPVC